MIGNPLKPVYLLVLVVVIAVVAIGTTLFYMSSKGKLPEILDGRGSENLADVEPAGCGDIIVSVNSRKEASSYSRFSIQRPAPEGMKLVVLEVSVVNTAQIAKDLSGYRMGLMAGGSEYSPNQFSSIERLTLLDGSVQTYSCTEANIASISRLVLEPYGSENGCKIFEVVLNQTPSSLNVYDLAGTKCEIPI